MNHIRVIGLDPGTHTGYAIATDGVLRVCESVPIHIAMARVERVAKDCSGALLVRFEDARKRQWLGDKGREALQGAGSIKRDCTIWEDFLVHLGIAFEAVAPSPGNTKWSAATFARTFKFEGRTNEHGRDAGVLAMIPERMAILRIEAFEARRVRAAA